jgi:hypothetical protein
MTMGSVASRAWIVVAAAVAMTASCSSEPAPVPARLPDVASVGRHVAPASELRGAMRSAAHAFRSEAGAFASGGSTFEATVDKTGAIAMLPRLPRAVGARLGLETVLVARGAHVLASGPGVATQHDDGSVVVQRSSVVERVSADDDGVEQSWTFARAPEGAGDLVVAIAGAGQRFTTSTEHGLHFASAGAGLGVRYGAATWVDATGARTTIAPRWVDGRILLVVPDSVVARSRFPAVLDPTITAEKETDTPAGGGSAASGQQYSPWIAAGSPGNGYLAVWYDYRGVRPAIFGARIKSDGTVQDTTGIAIATGVGYTNPRVYSNGNGYLVTWAVSYLDYYQNAGVYAVRLDAQGTVLDPAPLVVAANQTNVAEPSAAYDGTNWLVSWYRYAGTTAYDISAARVPGEGPITDPTIVDVAKTTDSELRPSVTYDGTNFFVVYETYTGIVGQTVGKDGKLVGTPLTIASSTALYEHSTAYDGNGNTLVVWSQYSSTYDVLGKIVTKAGAVGPQINVSVDGVNSDDRPRVAWDGTDFVVGFLRDSFLYSNRVSPAGVPTAPVGVLTTGTHYDFALASDGAASIAVDSEYQPAPATSLSDVMGTKIAKNPGASTTFIVSKAANSETSPDVAWNGTAHYAAWVDTRDPQPAIYGATLGPDGAPGVPKALVSNAGVTSLSSPRIASDGQGYLVVFAADEPTPQRRGIRGIRVNGDGSLNGAMFDVQVTPYAANEVDNNPDVAWDGTNYLVVWESQTTDGTGVAGIRVPRTTNTPVDKAPLRISTVNPVERRTDASIAFDGQSYFVAWITTRPTASGVNVSHVYGTRVSKDGAPLDGETVICDAFLFQKAPQVAADPANGGFFAAWEDYRTDLEAADVYGARISANGQNVDGPSGLKIAAGAYDESRPHVAPSGDGTNWVVAWRDLRSKSTYDVYGAWVSLAGRTHDPDGFLLSAEAGDEDAPRLSSEGQGKLLLAYQRLDPRTGYGSYRIRARAIDSGALVGTACAKNDDCASRSCVDGFCCSTECDGCGVCNVQKGTCTPRAAGDLSPTCPAYKCKGTVDCPTKCDTDADCTDNASCDPATHTCISRIICIDPHTLKDLTGNKTDCSPFKCVGAACLTQCGSVDDCADGFVCGFDGRCRQAPAPSDGGCAAGGSGASGTCVFASLAWLLASIFVRRRRSA